MEMKERLANLLCVKSIVTIVLTFVFAFLSIKGLLDADQFMTVFTVVVAFYFGTQAQKNATVKEGEMNAVNTNQG